MGTLVAFIAGSIVGSFLNVCISRLPKGESVVAPSSRCPRCKAKIRWYDNIPIISYITLGGRCRDCKGRISARYLIVEVASAALAVLLFARFGLAERFFAYSVMTAGLIVATFVDFEIQEIPDEVTIFGLIAGLCFALLFPQILGAKTALRGVLASLAGAAAGAFSIYAMGYLGEIVFKKEAMGGGDVKLLAMIGAFIGWKLALFVFFIAPVFGAVVGVTMKIRTGRETIPYGPYLSLGALIAIFWGEKILKLLFYGMQ